MDFTEVNKVAGRKRTSANVDKLRDKISRENKNIIKLKVAQDTAYWDLKEHLRQVEGNHEKLQANMVEVQMQHEAISGQYQEELRLRPETLNKLTSTREICDVLEDYSERLRDTLSRSKADQAALAEAYQRSGALVRELKTQHQSADENNRKNIGSLEDKIKLTSDHNTQLLQFFTQEKQKSDAELIEVKAKLEVMACRKDELVTAKNELARQMDLLKLEIQKKEETISDLQSNIKQMYMEFNSQASEMKSSMDKQEKEFKEVSLANTSLKEALTNQENFTKSMCTQNNQLQEKLAAAEDELTNINKVVEDLNCKLEALTVTNNELKVELGNEIKKKEGLEVEVAEKIELLTKAEEQITSLKDEIQVLQTNNQELTNELNKANDETQILVVKVQELKVVEESLEKKILDIEIKLTECCDTANQKIQTLEKTICDKNQEMESKTSTIGHLMSQVNTESEARANLEINIQDLRKEFEIERQGLNEKERKLIKEKEVLEGSVRGKEKELTNMVTIIQELRADKERLHDKIQSMQKKIDNIQKEISAPPAKLTRDPPDHDDNAVMLTPTRVRADNIGKPKPQPQFAVPTTLPKQMDSMVLNFLSDNSMDMDGDNTLDPNEVTRRFEALSRGERLSPTPLASLKRRRSGVPASQGGLRLKAAQKDVQDVPLSQHKEDMQKKDRAFFKNKQRHEKVKKIKPIPQN